MVDADVVKVLIMEEQYPFLTDEQLQAICAATDNLNEAVYTACKMKAKADKIKVGPITIENDAAYWNTLADSFYKKLREDFLLSSNNGSKYDFRDLLQDNDVLIGLEDWDNTGRHSKFIDFLKKIFREK